ncbi:hypothetical protein VPNG_09131 [Cytospora leucostoma]|uniref:Uncharacterized protein n=1 Tax=Cytospora leucostoma TaxID=1230097 RepID=A0A423VYG5_9PEZI|nr:hypothetical protein VPNG_09131 [Cytospora leucostoma]
MPSVLDLATSFSVVGKESSIEGVVGDDTADGQNSSMVKTRRNLDLRLGETILLVDVRQLMLPLLLPIFVMVGRSSSAHRQLGRARYRVKRRDCDQDIGRRRVVWMSDPNYWLTAVMAESWEGVRRWRGLGRWQRWWTEKSHRPPGRLELEKV